jgi:vitamin B12 transporter
MRITTALLLWLVAATPLAAQEPPDTFRLRQLVVTATRTPLPRSAIAAAVTIIDRADLQARGIQFVGDALRDVAGVGVVQSGSYGGVTSAFVRGGEPDYVQVLVDGVQVNDPGGVINFAHLLTADVERIEIVRGPVSVLYGSDAVAGVIHIITRTGNGRPRVTAELSGGRGSRVGEQADGTFAVVDWSAGITGSVPRLRYAVTASGTTTDGIYAFNNDYDNQSFSGKLQYASRRTDATMNARYVDREFHYPTNGAGAVVDPNKFSTGDLRTFGIDAGHRLHDRFELRAALGAHRASDGESDPRDNPTDGLSISRSVVHRRTADLRLNVHLPRSSVLTLGAEREWQDGRSSFHSESSFGPFDSSSDDTRDNTGWYAQLLAAPLAHTHLTIGGRIDHNERFGTFHTYRAGVTRQFNALKLHAALGTAFKEPTFFENYATGFVRGDPLLQPEESRNIEAGAEFTYGATTVQLTVFDQRFRNLIQYTASPPSPDDPNYHNIGAAVARGAELSAAVSLPRATSATLDYTYLQTEVTDEGFGSDRLFQDGEKLIRRPRHQASLTLRSSLTQRTRASATARIVGKRDDLDFTDPLEFAGKRVRQPAYGTLDVSLQHDLLTGTHGVTVIVGAENMLNEKYEPVFNFPARGRVLRAGIRAIY